MHLAHQFLVRLLDRTCDKITECLVKRQAKKNKPKHHRSTYRDK